MTLEELGIEFEFPKLLQRLGLTTAWENYESAVGDMFDSVADKVPTIGAAPTSESSGDDGAPEARVTYVGKLMEVVELMYDRVDEAATLPKQYSRTPYTLITSQDYPADEFPPPPDAGFVLDEWSDLGFGNLHIPLKAEEHASEPRAYDDYIGHVAEYALSAWENQPARIFVPVFFLHGDKLDLFVFTRRGYYLTSIGPVLHMEHCDREEMSARFGCSLCRLWFLLTLPVEQFGLFGATQGTVGQLKLDTSTTPATVTEGSYLDDTTVNVERPVAHSVPIIGNCTYHIDASYGEEKAVLKLTWARTDQLPEGVVYRVLEYHGVSNIPKLFQSGVIVKDFAGYRLEFLVMEHCGTSIVTHVQGVIRNSLWISKADELVKDSIDRVSMTLTETLAADILHRDVSADSFVIKDGAAHVVNWGSAKFIRAPADENLRAEIAETWSLNWNKTLAREKAKDLSTGTPMYMSTRLLLGAETCSIYDDLESLLYVVFDALARCPRTGKLNEQPIGFGFYDSSNVAAARLAYTMPSTLLCHYFGAILRVESTLDVVLEAMRYFLFFEDGIHIGGRILENKDFPRMFDDNAARLFMSDKTAGELRRLMGDQVYQRASATEAAFPLSVHRSLRHPRPVVLFSSPLSVYSAERGTRSKGSGISTSNAVASNSSYGAASGNMPSTRSGSLAACSMPQSTKRPASSTFTSFAPKAIVKGTTLAGPSRIPICPASFRTSAFPGKSTKVTASDGKRSTERPARARGHSSAPVSRNNNSLAKADVCAVGKKKTIRVNLSNGNNKWVCGDNSKLLSPRQAKRRRC
ncbi:hypothetical protein IWW57_002461 [Coemansia sp. S610]|nr:hypothetical protein IWW57_002461 [Coemansia sp. S610]